MKEILRFVALFIVVYASVILLQNTSPVQSGIQKSFRALIEVFLKSTFPKAYIVTQDFKDESGKKDPNVFYITYGNPEVIQAEHDYARKNQMKEYKISTYSIQLYVFQLFTVPIAFLIALFLASPMLWRTKLKYLSLTIVLMTLIIMAKVCLLTLYHLNISQTGVYTISNEEMSWVFRGISMLTLGFSIMIGFVLWLIFGFKNSSFVQLVNSFFKSLQQ